MGIFLQYLGIVACGLASIVIGAYALTAGFRLIIDLFRDRDWHGVYFMLFALMLVSMIIGLIPQL